MKRVYELQVYQILIENLEPKLNAFINRLKNKAVPSYPTTLRYGAGNFQFQISNYERLLIF